MRSKVLSFLLALGLALAPASAASLLPNGEQQFADANGLPYAAGTVGFYIPNTLTPKATWKDSGQTVQNTNPVVLDSAGRAVIYGGGAYRQILKDVFGNTVWDKLTYGVGSGGLIINATITGVTALSACSGVYPINAGAPITITLPALPGDGDTCEFVDAGNTAGTNATTFSFGSNHDTKNSGTFPLNYNQEVISFTWLANIGAWAPN